MRFRFLYIIILLNCFIATAQNADSSGIKYSQKKRGVDKIDKFDTVVFDMSKAVLLDSNYFEIPVFIKSDDDIQCLDFWFKYNHKNILFKHVLDYTGHIQATDYESPIDSVVRFSSNSLPKVYEKYPLKVVGIRFRLIGKASDSSDINFITVLLCGDSSSHHLINGHIGLSVGINDVVNSPVVVYPNPSNKILTIAAAKNATIRLFDLGGREIYIDYRSYFKGESGTYQLDISSLSNGTYIVQLTTDQTTKALKVVVNNE